MKVKAENVAVLEITADIYILNSLLLSKFSKKISAELEACNLSHV